VPAGDSAIENKKDTENFRSR
jgi:hypothetical protein